MYNVEIYKTILAGDMPNEEEGIMSKLKYLDLPYPDMVSFKYSLTLPYTHFVGLSIINDGFQIGEIKNIDWFHDEELFACHLKDEQPYSFKGYDYTYEWLIKNAEDHGWKKLDDESDEEEF